MGSIWQRLDALAGRAANAVFSEAVRIMPRLANEYIASQPDASRQEATVRGIFSLEPSTDDLRGQRISGESRGALRMVFAEAVIQITAAEAALIGFMPVKSDLIKLIDRPGCMTYAVEHVEPFDSGDIALYLTKETVE